MKYQLKTQNYNNESPELALHNLLQERGIQDPVKWLHPTEEYEHSPFTLENMAKAIDLLHAAIRQPDTSIMVVVDSDLDGYTSGAIIMTLLKQICQTQEVNYVLHPGKEHGIELKDIPEHVDLVIVPDAGSSQKQEHLTLLENGTKIIILDHHEIDNDMNYGTFADNIAIVNNQLNYPNPALSGAGVALKFVQAYCQSYGVPFPMKLYGLAACGIVADVMDISSLENKQIIETGIKYIGEHLFLMELIKKAHYNMENPTPSIKDIGWVVGPNINSIIRLGTMAQKVMIFRALVSPCDLTFSSKKGAEDEQVCIYEEAARLCSNAKKRQTTAIERSIRIMLPELEDNEHNSIVYIDEDQELSFELSGLIANKILSKYNKPVILLRRFTNGKDINEYRGSIRGKPAEGLDSLKDTIKNITGVDFVEGHAFAAGIGIDADSINEFKLHLNSILDQIDFNTNMYLVDLVSHYNAVNKEIAEIMAKDDIWGHGVEKPLAVVTDIPTNRCEVMGADGQHLKINCGKYDAVLFNVPQLTEALDRGEKFNLNCVGEFDIDTAYNVGRLQFMVKDYETEDYKPSDIWDMVF